MDRGPSVRRRAEGGRTEFHLEEPHRGVEPAKAYTNGGLVPPIDWTRQHKDPTASVANRAKLQCVNFLRIHDGKFVGIYDDGGAKPWVCFHGQQPDTWEKPENLSFATP
jgi:hypothetical protein